MPWPTSTNRVWRTGAFGRVYTSHEVKEFRKAVAVSLHLQRVPRIRANGSLGIRILIYPAELCAELDGRRHRRLDVDNALKATFDSLTHSEVIDDDRWIDELHLERVASSGEGGLDVTLWRRADLTA